MKKVFLHLKKIIIHKYWVGKYCFKAGLYWQGITHDLSKFSPTEFFESVKYYQGNGSPINACKAANGYSKAWFHHRGRNPHHYEMWVDNFDHGGKPLIMPYKYAMEMFCDYLGAARAYNGKDFSIVDEIQWWENKKAGGIMMHPRIIAFMDDMFWCAEHYGLDYVFAHSDIVYSDNVKR